MGLMQLGACSRLGLQTYLVICDHNYPAEGIETRNRDGGTDREGRDACNGAQNNLFLTRRMRGRVQSRSFFMEYRWPENMMERKGVWGEREGESHRVKKNHYNGLHCSVHILT